MDGVKKRLTDSVQFKLSVTLSVAILAAAILAGIFSFISAFDEAHELQDDVLLQVAQLVDRQHLTSEAPFPDGARPVYRDEESRVIVQRLGDKVDPAVDVDDGGLLALPAGLPDGLQTLTVGHETFRVLIRTTRAGERIAVAQEAGFRNGIAREGAIRTVTPLLILMPVLLLIVADLVRKLFRPISVLSREIDGRDERELHPVEHHHLPAEVRPFVVAINRLLARVENAMASQRRFVADAAHELRSPLTALSLQAERLADTDLPGPARERLVSLRQGIERSRILLDQLLSFARAQSAADLPPAAVSVQSVFRRVLEDLMPLAEDKHIDVGVDSAEDVQVWGSEFDLIALVRNLVDNAIRYTPCGGKVDLSARMAGGSVVLCVHDTGPGIPLAERERVFDPFYRVLGSEEVGSGLGLSIVRSIADRMEAQVDLGYADDGAQTGLRVTLRFPAPPPFGLNRS
jgi:two-component system OmpR family sensor kinase